MTIEDALRTIGHEPDRYDADALFGALTARGVVVLDPHDVDGNELMVDRCDMEPLFLGDLEELEDWLYVLRSRRDRQVVVHLAQAEGDG